MGDFNATPDSKIIKNLLLVNIVQIGLAVQEVKKSCIVNQQ